MSVHFITPLSTRGDLHWLLQQPITYYSSAQWPAPPHKVCESSHYPRDLCGLEFHFFRSFFDLLDSEIERKTTK